MHNFEPMDGYRKFLLFFVACNILLGVGLATLDWYGLLPPPAFSKSISFDEKAAWLHDNAPPQIDIMALGSSMTLNNFNSAVVFDNFPKRHYVNVSSWGLKFENIYKYFCLLDKSYDVSTLLVCCSIVDFREDQIWQQVPNAGLLQYYLDGGSEAFCQVTLFSGSYFVGNAQKMQYLRTRNDHYKSLRFDAGGGVPFAAQGFDIDPSRWEGKFLRDVVVEKRNYAALGELARYCRAKGITFVLSTTPCRPQALAYLPAGLLSEHMRRLRSLAKSESFLLVEADEGDLDDGMFVDWGHLNVKGAKRYTASVIGPLKKGGIL